ncbi:MAG: formylglycine-generating enzyme family protein [Candidatus Zixiibacteriota bacterium]|nr:MAG: formylglycine-generating enzyme family protein [candidate division Zixibacteria bacterium]
MRRHVAVAVLFSVVVLTGLDASGQDPDSVQSPEPVVRTNDDSVIVVQELGLVLRLLPPGAFTMGGDLDNEQPCHRVEITKPFYIGVYEITQEQYEKVMGSNPSGFTGPNHPVERVSWNDATAFCRKLSQMTGDHYRLPTEAEWEYAARGCLESKKYSWGDQEIPIVNGLKQANVADESARDGRPDSKIFAGYDDGYVGTAPVGSFAPNGFGLYDMAGNVWERCSDWYDENYYRYSPEQDPQGPSSGEKRVLRGGGYWFKSDCLRVAYRCGSPLDRGGNNDGFRVVREVSTSRQDR